MRATSALGAICGDGAPHCAWCPTAAILAALGFAGLYAEWRSDRDDSSQSDRGASMAIPARRPS